MTGGGFSLVDRNDSTSAGQFAGSAYIRGPSFLHLPILTVSLLGVQIFWSVEMSYASPYLLSLGLSKSHMALVFLAGPLSGLLVQPLIGIMADACTSTWGRRRPYMMIGTTLCVLAMLLLGWTRQVAEWFTNDTATLTLWLAVLSICLIDLCINGVQAVNRALIVDSIPPSLQPAGNAWAARMQGMGSIIAFFIGYLDLPPLLPFLGSTELQIISILVSIILVGAQVITGLMVNERVLLKNSDVAGASAKSLSQEMKDIFTSIWTLPRVIQQICLIEFIAWLSWFPILFYTTVYVGDLHRRTTWDNHSRSAIGATLARSLHYVASHILPARSSDSKSSMFSAPIDEEATRLGSRALFCSAVFTLSMNVLLPFFVTEASVPSRRRGSESRHSRQQQTYGVIGGERSSGINQFEIVSGPKRLMDRLKDFSIPEVLKVHLTSLWAASHAVIAGCMIGTFFVSSVTGATFLVTLTGFSWAVTQWAPFALLGEAILTEPASSGTRTSTDSQTRLSSSHRKSFSMSASESGNAGPSTVTGRSRNSERKSVRDSRVGEDSQIFIAGHASDSESDREDDDLLAREAEEERRKLFATSTPATVVSPVRSAAGGDYGDIDQEVDEEARLFGSGSDVAVEQSGDLSDKAGIILGIHNMSMSLPQIIIIGLSSIIFAIFDSGPIVVPESSALSGDDVVEDPPRPSNALVYIFRLGAVWAIIAFVLTCQLARELRHR
ncbi:hypothetical protein K435DRAFT_963326 [Dendrothele bispora CBS 962.96]|uniref:MFS general substrate transporter n=1 Tax=Dendrothele bispora (strain CBS 962.96) TaxID=1314807 RepID=A0A4S8MI63_DENBC|nr:hypothetical protein K435DRAFT_963326 [Dendrothele bispora CBS 962.96]